MKSNVDLTERGHFSEGWMPGGWSARGVFRKRKPMKTSQKFKKILKMGIDDKPYSVSSIVSKLFGIPATIIGRLYVDSGNDITFSGQGQLTNVSGWATSSSTTTITTNGTNPMWQDTVR